MAIVIGVIDGWKMKSITTVRTAEQICEVIKNEIWSIDKSTDELESTDFSEETTSKYKNIKIQRITYDDTIISYIRESDGKEVVTTFKQLLEEW